MKRTKFLILLATPFVGCASKMVKTEPVICGTRGNQCKTKESWVGPFVDEMLYVIAWACMVNYFVRCEH